ncbi:MAG: DNA-processing protein DprA, partial [Alphaproteobacteria bacterium]
DRSAHQGALISGTIVVLGNGIDIPYSSQNRDIYQTIKQSGLILSARPFGQKPAALFFLNKIVSLQHYQMAVLQFKLPFSQVLLSLHHKQLTEMFRLWPFQAPLLTPRSRMPPAYLRPSFGWSVLLGN